jgi:hypothetical protein
MDTCVDEALNRGDQCTREPRMLFHNPVGLCSTEPLGNEPCRAVSYIVRMSYKGITIVAKLTLNAADRNNMLVPRWRCQQPHMGSTKEFSDAWSRLHRNGYDKKMQLYPRWPTRAASKEFLEQRLRDNLKEHVDRIFAADTALRMTEHTP